MKDQSSVRERLADYTPKKEENGAHLPGWVRLHDQLEEEVEEMRRQAHARTTHAIYREKGKGRNNGKKRRQFSHV